MARKDHTQVAERIRGSALGLFRDAHDALERANKTLDDGMTADSENRKMLDERIALATEQLEANKRVSSKLKELFT